MRIRSLIVVCLLAACGGESNEAVCPKSPPPLPVTPPAPLVTAPPAPTVDEARAFVDDVEAHLHRLWVAGSRANWVNENFITDDTEALAAAGEEATAGYIGDAIKRSRRFDTIRDQLPPDIARKLYLLSVAQTIPAPSDADKRAELASIEAWMPSAYGKGTYCPPSGSPLLKYASKEKNKKGEVCLHLDELSKVLAKSRKFDELLEAWRGWHAIAPPMKTKFVRYVDLANAGAKEIGFDDVGALWRSAYDMPPAEFEADIERLWTEVKPLYDELHCYVRGKLQSTYGKDKVPDHGTIPAHLLGNMWAQEWNNVYDLVVPYPHEPSLDVSRKLVSDHWDALKMVHQAEHFFTALGFAPVPATFWDRSLFVRPRDRDVVCHASAWDVDYSGDLRIKACLQPTEEDLVTVHHELGHIFYDQSYDKLPALFSGAPNDGFHEAIGDTMALSVTPEYLKSLGLLDAVPKNEHARVNEQLRMALDKVAFLPFGLLIDKWRWDVFAGKVKPADYNAAWWKLREHYQGVSAPVPRTADDFDPASKYHVTASVPYMRYFLARLFQFQFHRALCDAAGYKGPLDQCSIHDNAQAGAKLKAMLAMGATKPWPDALEAVGAGRKANAGPMLEYFGPLRQWLAEQNKGQKCGW